MKRAFAVGIAGGAAFSAWSVATPQVYLAANYADLLGLQVFSWTIAVAAQVVVAGTAGWYLRRVHWLRGWSTRA
jgi:hypothetical protein